MFKHVILKVKASLVEQISKNAMIVHVGKVLLLKQFVRFQTQKLIIKLLLVLKYFAVIKQIKQVICLLNVLGNQRRTNLYHSMLYYMESNARIKRDLLNLLINILSFLMMLVLVVVLLRQILTQEKQTLKANYLFIKITQSWMTRYQNYYIIRKLQRMVKEKLISMLYIKFRRNVQKNVKILDFIHRLENY